MKTHARHTAVIQSNAKDLATEKFRTKKLNIGEDTQFRRMGGAQRYPSHLQADMMGIGKSASTHPTPAIDAVSKCVDTLPSPAQAVG